MIMEIIEPTFQTRDGIGDNPRRVAQSIILSAQRLASSTVHSLDRTLPWLSGARELRDRIEVAFANHFERQIEDELALCGSCGGNRVNYCEREGPTGVSFDGCSGSTPNPAISAPIAAPSRTA